MKLITLALCLFSFCLNAKEVDLSQDRSYYCNEVSAAMIKGGKASVLTPKKYHVKIENGELNVKIEHKVAWGESEMKNVKLKKSGIRSFSLNDSLSMQYQAQGDGPRLLRFSAMHSFWDIMTGGTNMLIIQGVCKPW